MSDGFDFQVIVAGGGPVGMATAIELAIRGIRVLMCEARPEGVINTARVNLTNARSMEHFRRLGMADHLRANDPVPSTVIRDVTFITRATGKVLVNLEGGCEWRQRLPIASEVPEWAPHQAIEKTLLDRLNELPAATIHNGTFVADFKQDADGVDVVCNGPDGRKTLRAHYLVAADGSRSELRKKLNVPMVGETLFYNVSWHFRAPSLLPLFANTQLSSLTFFINEDAYADLIMPQSGDDHYVYMISPLPADVDPNNWEQIKTMLYRSVGEEFEIFDPKNSSWGSHSRMAPSYNFGRVLLAGDAAHLTSPFGGFGMNMGIGDAADIGWKLDAMLGGWGGQTLLDSYTIERREAERFIIDGSAYNNKMTGKELVRPYMEEDSPRGEEARAEVRDLIINVKTQEFRSIGAQLGYRYLSSPVVVADRTEAPPLDYGDYQPLAIPGCRAPHIWLEDDSSLFDHFGGGFCLLKLDPAASTAALEAAAAKRGVPLTLFELDNAEACALYERKLILIRPDQHVAWRGDSLPDDCERIIDVVRGAAGWRC
jgi:2-polyprenyl-6-methoxyphenol hydroxylase-like FAD-dependent oxidoreductase